MLELRHLERVARTFANLAKSAPTEEARREMLAAAEEYYRRAEVRRKALDAVRSISDGPTDAR